MIMRLGLRISLLSLLAFHAISGQAPNYAKAESWLCRPGRNDACAVDLTTTVVDFNGGVSVERFAPAKEPPIDCFYVYGTVSNDSTPNSDLFAGPEERDVIELQLARFGSVCRLYAPLYRQQTLRQMRVMLAGGTMAYLDTAYADVRAAWDHYIEHDNHGRGVVLIGHSQGARMLVSLLQERIDGRPVSTRLVSALLAGFGVGVARGRDTGGTFSALPLCHDSASVGCVVAWASFRDTMIPAPNSLYGRVRQAEQAPACVNPAALLGKTDLHAYLPSRGGPGIIRAGRAHSWVTQNPAITTPYLSLPGRLQGKCVESDGAHVLAVTTQQGEPGKPAYVLGGDIMTNGRPDPLWGLHLLDIGLVQGDLIELIHHQSTAFAARKR